MHDTISNPAADNFPCHAHSLVQTWAPFPRNRPRSSVCWFPFQSEVRVLQFLANKVDPAPRIAKTSLPLSAYMYFREMDENAL